MTCIGTIKEIKNNENRVGLTPEGAKQLVELGHTVIIQAEAGKGAGFHDHEYQDAGAEIRFTAEDVAKECDILVKVKEPMESEYSLLEALNGKTLFTYLHLSGVPKSLTEKLLAENITAIAYETVMDESGGLPLLAPMSEVAGVLAVQYGAEYLQKKHDGHGVTLGEITGVDRSRVVIVGAGVVGTKAAQTALGMGCQVTLFDINQQSLDRAKAHLESYFTPKLMEHINLCISTEETVNLALKHADLLVGAVLVPGARAPRVITANQVSLMKDGAVIVDVAIDQGGCIEGSKATTHAEPTYIIDGKIYCCVANMPGQAPRQSTLALTNATLPYLVKLANAESLLSELQSDPGFQRGLNCYAGKITLESVAKDLEMTDHLGKR
jgi:alanine dehydrogenase